MSKGRLNPSEICSSMNKYLWMKQYEQGGDESLFWYAYYHLGMPESQLCGI